jgi:hypothetical protein
MLAPVDRLEALAFGAIRRALLFLHQFKLVLILLFDEFDAVVEIVEAQV